MKLSLVAVMFLTCIARQTLAQTNSATTPPQPPPITGAFGLVLGTKVDLSKCRATGTSAAGDLKYVFTPTNPAEGLTKYNFQATPKTGIIYEIVAAGKFANREAAQNRLKILSLLIKNKYGMTEAEELRPKGGPMVVYKRESRYIAIGSDESGVIVALYYNDEILGELAKKERIELDSSKTDDKGL